MLLECVPNLSEGRDAAVIAALGRGIAATDGVFLLDTHSDPDHNRTVFTFVGPPPAVAAAAFGLARDAAARLDIHAHQGVHPRMGLVDVCPFIPLGATPMEDAVRTARDLGARLAAELEIPVYLYGEAALSPDRAALPRVRRANLAALGHEIASDPARAPDLGPHVLHPRFGAIAVGARTSLVAYNIDLDGEDIEAARDIATAVRERDGGLDHVRALGLPLPSRRRVQVSCNLLDGEATPPAAVFKVVSDHAAHKGMTVARSELVGLIPREVVYRSLAASLLLEPFTRAQVLEERVAEALPLHTYTERLADPSGGPGGGAVAADVGALAAGLVAFTAGVTGGRRAPAAEKARALALHFMWLSRRDQEVFAALVAARAEGNAPHIAAALRQACDVPVGVMETVRDTLACAAAIEGRGAIMADLRIAAHLLAAAGRGAAETLAINLKPAAANGFRDALRARTGALIEEITSATARCTGAPGGT